MTLTSVGVIYYLYTPIINIIFQKYVIIWLKLTKRLKMKNTLRQVYKEGSKKEEAMDKKYKIKENSKKDKAMDKKGYPKGK